ncbi:energy-coupling factor ABC transporter substrate-binding protein [Methanosphaerula palustris]|uniref:Cobalt transport protein CbiN n=1 Tax=Methanosphaerula palustris (strain ATCC BAA-1556 / DSM 19958 / E1-9c) TaxID=521011 RepID=B8GJH0_METPE|nr:energy-coupling factor ABC transporter substrate-binding protein [Methanosphaerula palustris]ACL17011.1 Cobalt transport protein CbiN [Methanosphaerula palustris E1-9c]
MKYTLEIIAIMAVVIFAGIFVVVNAHMAGTLAPGEVAWGGSDDGATKIIESTGYTPWFSPIYTPPSSEIETLFFCLQSAAGALVIGYFFGYYRGRQERKNIEQTKKQV